MGRLGDLIQLNQSGLLIWDWTVTHDCQEAIEKHKLDISRG